MLNLPKIHADFPALHQKVHGQRLAFLDSAASAQKPLPVLEGIRTFETTLYANIHRGLYALSQQATEAYEDARVKVAHFINVPKNSIIFTRNTTEAINLVAQTWARQNLKRGDAILLSDLEHHANIVPWQILAEEKRLEIIVAPCTKDGALTLAEIKKAWQPHIKLAALSHMSNALGTQPDVENIAPFVHKNGAKILVDGSQRVVHGPVDVTALDADFYAFTGHKLYGPTGIGVLYGKPDLLASMPPYQGGGDMIEEVILPTGTTYAPPPARFEAGTPNITGAVGLATALDYLQGLGWENIQQHEKELLETATEKLAALKGITLYGTAAPKSSVLSFTVEGAHPSDVATILDQCGVAVRTGHHCCMPLMKKFGITGTIRASFAPYNTLEDVAQLVNAVQKAQKMLT